MRPTLLRAYDAAGQVIVEMAMPADGPANFHADRPVAYVVFYEGEIEFARVIGRKQMSFPPQGDVWVDWEEPSE